MGNKGNDSTKAAILIVLIVCILGFVFYRLFGPKPTPAPAPAPQTQTR